MFSIGLNASDVRRIAWSFVFGVLGYVILAQASILDGTVDWKALAAGAVMAGLSAVKNLVLADGSKLK